MSFGKYISLNEIEKEPTNIEDFMTLAYEDGLSNIAKGAIYVNGTNKNLYEVYNAEVDTGINGYFYANTILFVSAFLKKEYDIDATILMEISHSRIGGDSTSQNLINLFTDSLVLVLVCLISLFGFVIFLGGLMFDKIKEKRTNIKHLLYLSGGNLFSYWIGFFIVDYLKLFFFNILLIFPIFFVNNSAYYFGLDMLAISLSSLSFIYFISFFCSKDDEGAKILFLFIFGFVILIVLYFVVAQPEMDDFLPMLFDAYKPTIFDVTPVTSMVLSFVRLMISYTLYSEVDKYNVGGEEIEDNTNARMLYQHLKNYILSEQGQKEYIVVDKNNLDSADFLRNVKTTAENRAKALFNSDNDLSVHRINILDYVHSLDEEDRAEYYKIFDKIIVG